MPYFELFNSYGVVPISGDGPLDLGVDGMPVRSGGAHARVTFMLTETGSTTLEINSMFLSNGIVLARGEVITRAIDRTWRALARGGVSST